LDKKKGKIIKDLVLNWIQTKIINGFLTQINAPKEVIFAVNILTNLDQISIIQAILAKMGAYKFILYVMYFGFVA
jgi:hypothetical protein